MDSLIKFTRFQSSEFISKEFVDFLIAQCPLGNSPIHGLKHWTSVLENGRKLAAETGANLKVVELFSVLHDAKRENENDDPEHGHRAAALARECNGKWFHLDDVEMQDLDDACYYHADGFTKHTVTVMTCWDSDRLDLGRVGITPNEKYLCTTYAKTLCSQI